MKNFGALTLIAMLLFGTAAPATAHGGGYYHREHGHVFVGLLLAPLLLPFQIAAAITTGVVAVVSAPFAYLSAPPPVAPAYALPAPAYAPPVYAPAPPPAPSYWYYCPSAGGYYPYVPACPTGWLRVAPR